MSEAATDEEIDADGSIEVLDPTGHFEVRWGKKKSEVDHAEALFKDLLSKGYLAFKKTWIGRKGKQADAFDPKDRVLIFEKSEAPVPVEAERVPALEDAEKPSLPKPSERAVEKTEDESDEHEYQKTKEFDKKGKHTLVPPLRGG